MGRYQEGLLGHFSGKVGPVIGSSWKGVGYMRGKGKLVKRRVVSDKIANHREKFKFAGNFIKAMGDLLSITFPQATTKMSARNIALAGVMEQAIKGEAPDLSIDYSLVKVAGGSLKGVATGSMATSSQPGVVTFAWDDNTEYGNGKPGDKAILIAYCEQMNSCRFTIGDGTRASGTGQLDVRLFSGKEVHTWISFLGENDKSRVAPSAYTGKVTVA